MSYQVIARKWRPQTFEEVTGQEPITRTLRNAIEHERLHHAYLFSGARGVGKTTTARLLAKSLNCRKSQSPTATPCRIDDPSACDSCREIAESRSIDVLEIDAASNTGVDNVRDAIIGNVAISPARDRYKVFIIDEVHMLSGAAFNALLKTLEEPPPRVVFIMATTESHKLPDTILSRCQQFEFRTIAPARIAERLRLIADAEQVSISEEALREIARAGEGSMRDAQSAFDQVISFSGSEIKAEDVETALGVAGTQVLARVVDAIAARKPAEALAVVDDLVMRGHDLRNFCRDLLAHLRDLLVAKISGETAELLESSATERCELVRQAAGFSEADLIRFFHSLSETENNLRTAAQPRYQLEVGLVKLMEMGRVVPLDQLLERLTALEESLRTSQSPAAQRTPPAAAAGGGSQGTGVKGPGVKSASGTFTARAGSAAGNDERAAGASPLSEEPPFGGVGGSSSSSPSASQPSAVASPPLTLVPPVTTAQAGPAASVPQPSFGSRTTEASDRIGMGVPVAAAAAATASGGPVERIKAGLEQRKRMFLVVALEGARRAVVEGDELLVEFAPEAKHLCDSLAKPENAKLLREVCREVLGRDMGVRISIGDAAGAGNQDAGPSSRQEEERLEKQRLREIAEQDPSVQEFLRTFRGEILDVRRVDSEQ
ncbi:MAG TPA: DNA polymerase III subunit gamma/tau [Pyrinomonadaceae bacterium]|jgi:DNA polymerase-3 subunit gamma/tau